MFEKINENGDRMEYMANYDLSDLRRETVMQGFMIMYLQEEQKKRQEELDQIERNLSKMRNDPKFKELLKIMGKNLNPTV
jgi:hypothetical protein